MKNFNMKKFTFLIMFILASVTIFSQRAIEITNNHNANYKQVVGTKVKIVPPQGFVASTSYLGFTHQIAGSSIVITEIAGDVNMNMIGFDSKQLFKTGVIVETETYYLIDDFNALLITGKQSAYGKVYKRIMLVIGDVNRTYLLSASILSNTSEKHVKEVTDALLSIIYSPKQESDIMDRFDFSVNTSGTILKKGNLMLSSMTFTDDGSVPSATKEKTSFIVRKSTVSKPLTAEEKKTLGIKLFNLYPLEWEKDMSREPKDITIGKLKGYEIYCMGVNKELYKNELIYQVIIFNNNDYYVITGITYGKFEESLSLFKQVAKTFKPYK